MPNGNANNRDRPEIYNHLSGMQPFGCRDDANRCVSMVLRVLIVRRRVETQAGRLLCILFLWDSCVPAHTGKRRVLWLAVVRCCSQRLVVVAGECVGAALHLEKK